MKCNTFFDPTIRFLFDLDGTLGGYEDQQNNIKNRILITHQDAYYTPLPSMRWSIITSRPKLDRLLIHRFCHKNRLYPESIITYNQFVFGLHNIDDIVDWKFMYIIKLLSHNFIKKIVYIDNNKKVLNRLPRNSNLLVCNLSTFSNLIDCGEFQNVS